MIDVGSNMGQIMSYPWAWSSHITLYCIEANPANLKHLQKATPVNNFREIHVLQYAASDYDGETTFYANTNDAAKVGNQVGSLGKTMAHYNVDDKNTFKVPVTRLDSMFIDDKYGKHFDKFERVSLLKIDTEGFDVLVMKGGRNIVNMSQIVLFECHKLMDTKFGGPGSTHQEAAGILAALNFEVYKLGPERALRFDGDFYHPKFDEMKDWHNCMAVKKDLPWKQEIFAEYQTTNGCEGLVPAP